MPPEIVKALQDGLTSLSIDHVKVRKNIHIWPVVFKGQIILDTHTGDVSGKISCKDQLLNGTLSLSQAERCVEYRKRFGLPLPLVGSRLGAFVVTLRWQPLGAGAAQQPAREAVQPPDPAMYGPLQYEYARDAGLLGGPNGTAGGAAHGLQGGGPRQRWGRLWPHVRMGFELRQGKAEVVQLNAVRFKPRLMLGHVGMEARTQLAVQLPSRLLFDVHGGGPSGVHRVNSRLARGTSYHYTGEAPQLGPEEEDDTFGLNLDIQELNLVIQL